MDVIRLIRWVTVASIVLSNPSPASEGAPLTLMAATGPPQQTQGSNASNQTISVPTAANAKQGVPDADRLALRIRVTPEGDGLAANETTTLQQSILQDARLAGFIKFVTSEESLSLGKSAKGEFEIIDADGITRNTASSLTDLSELIQGHLLQHRLLLPRDIPPRWRDALTLTLELVISNNPRSACQPAWSSVEWSVTGARLLADCSAWRLHASLDSTAPGSLQLHATLLLSDGTIAPFKQGDREPTLAPGQAVTLDDTFQSGPPFDVEDVILVSGTPAKKPPTSTEESHRSLLHMDELTRATLRLRVQERLDFNDPEHSGVNLAKLREYTLHDFDVHPYLPTALNSPLRDVLFKADSLVTSAKLGRVRYRELLWDAKKSDEDNLRAGIDCSTAIWFVFTRSGVPYTAGNRKVTTAEMARDDGPMAKSFNRCSLSQAPRLGDLLVYRDEKQGDGHVVMVIDPLRRIAWGSHGWDGNAGLLKIAPLTGVEYQFIKSPRDWDRWDRPNMRAVACWRSRSFVEQRASVDPAATSTTAQASPK